MNKNKLWYLGFVVCGALLLVMALADLPEIVDAGLAVAFGAVFGVSWAQIWYAKQLEKDEDFAIEVADERNVQIKYRAGYLASGVDMFLFSAATVLFLVLDYIVPAVVTGVMLAIQPVILILASRAVEKRI